MIDDSMMIFPGTASFSLTESICAYLKVPVGESMCKIFSDGNIFVHVKESVRGRDVFIVQSTIYNTNDKFMELLFWIDAFKRASAASVTAVIPYFSYGKGDKKDQPRVSIRARVCADALEAAGCSRVVTLDLHSPQIQGFFRIPVDNLGALPILSEEIRLAGADNLVVVAADTGIAEEARKFARHLGTPVAICVKERPRHDERAEVTDIVGDVKGKNALIVDDFVISGGTLTKGAERLRAKGASRVMAAVTHGVFSTGSMERIAASELDAVYTTDSVENRPEALNEKIHVVSAAPCFGEAIRRILRRESLGDLFPNGV